MANRKGEPGTGMMATCHRCGSAHERTGEERLGPWQTAFGPGRYRIQSAEYICTQCGNRVWAEEDTVEEQGS